MNPSAPSYKANDPRGWCGDPKRGAAMGRSSIHDAKPESVTCRLYLRRVRLDSGGYDPNGTYFGIGQALYWASDDADGSIDYMLRAGSRADAKRQVLKQYPNARFFR